MYSYQITVSYNGKVLFRTEELNKEYALEAFDSLYAHYNYQHGYKVSVLKRSNSMTYCEDDFILELLGE